MIQTKKTRVGMALLSLSMAFSMFMAPISANASGFTWWDPSTETTFVAKASVVAATAATPIDPSDLSNWTVYDHYSSSLTDASMPASWSKPDQPWFGWLEASSTNYAAQTFYDLNTQAGKNALEANRLPATSGYPTVGFFSNHIYTSGSADNAEMTFLGYSTGYFTDFAIAPVAATSDAKTIGFDIDGTMVYPHTLDGFGIMFNAGVSGSTLKSYILNFKATTNQIQLIDVSNGTDVNALHGGTPGGVSPWVSNTAGSTTQLVENAGSVKNLGGFTLATSPIKKIRVELEILQSSVIIKLAYYNSSTYGDLSAYTTFTENINATGAHGFGPFVNYTGNGHTCNQLSWVRFSNMQMAINFSVIFDKNDGSGDTHDRINDITPHKSLAEDGKTMPAVPTRPGYTFTGWNSQSDGKGTTFDVNSKVDKITTVYAMWEQAIAPTITITGNQTAWTNKDITLNIGVNSSDSYNLNNVTTTGGNTTINTNPNAKTYSGSVTFSKNGTLKVDASTSYPLTATKSEAVTKIDKTAPTVTGSVPKKQLVNSSNFSAISFNDLGDTGVSDASGVNAAKQILYLYKNATDTTPTYTIPWTSLSNLDNRSIIPAGKYYYAVSVNDNATNYGDSLGKTSANGNDLPNGPGDSGKPATPDDYIIIGADTPIVTEVSRTFPTTGYTNKDVTVTYKVSSILELSSINADGTNVPVTGTPQTGTLTFTQNGSKIVEGTNIAGLNGKGTLVVNNIDKLAPAVNTSSVPEKTQVTASSFSGVAFSDTGVSGVNTSTQTLYLYSTPTSTTPAYTIKWSNLSTDLAGVASGKYYYAVSVCDNAGNYADSRGKTSDNGNDKPDGPGDGGKPGTTDDYIIIGNAPTTVTEVSRTTPTTGYTNKDVTVTYKASSLLELEWVKEAGGTITVSGTTYTGTLTFTQNGSKIVDASNILHTTGTGTFTVDNIDKLAPTIVMPSNGSTFKPADILISDPAATASYASSGISSATVTAYEYIGGKPSTTPITGTLEEVKAKLKPGFTYDITITAVDNATNQTGPMTAIGVKVDNGEVVGALKISQSFDSTTMGVVGFSVSSNYPIVSVSSNGTTIYLPPSPTSTYVSLTASVTPSSTGGAATIVAIDSSGKSISVTLTAKPSGSTTLGTINTNFTATMTAAQYTMALNAITATGTNITSKETIDFTTGSVIPPLTITRGAKPLYVVVKVSTTDGQTFYVGAGSIGTTRTSVPQIKIT